MQVSGKAVIVTGASSGIGKATAILLSKKGAKVALVARSRDKLESLAKNLSQSFVVVTDVTKEDEIKTMVQKVKEHFGRIDILINNAGQGYDSLVEHINIKTFHEIFDLTLIGPLFAMQQVIPTMRSQGMGSIINISSGTALMVLPTMSPYACLKSALAKMALTAREELKKDKINVSVVDPYITQTDFEKHTIVENHANDWVWERDERRTPPPADPPEFAAQKIVEAIETEKAEIYAHEWMGMSR